MFLQYEGEVINSLKCENNMSYVVTEIKLEFPFYKVKYYGALAIFDYSWNVESSLHIEVKTVAKTVGSWR